MATETTGQPTVILAQHREGLRTLGKDLRGQATPPTSMKKLNEEASCTTCATGFNHAPSPTPSSTGSVPPYFHPGEDSDSPEVKPICTERRTAARRLRCRNAGSSALTSRSSAATEPTVYDDRRPTRLGRRQRGGDDNGLRQACSRTLMKRQADRARASSPIVPDEARTFGMDSLFPTARSIYSASTGQRYEAVDRELLLVLQGSRRRARSCTRKASARPGAMSLMVIAAGDVILPRTTASR